MTLGGAERVVLSIQEWIGARNGVEGQTDHLTIPQWEGVNFVSSLGIFIHIESHNNAFLREVKDRGYPYVIFPMRFAFDLANLIQLIKYLKTNQIQLLHTHGYRSDIVGIICARMARIPVVSTLHGWTSTNWRVKGYEKIQLWSLPFFTAIIAVSREIKEYVVNKIKINSNKIIVIQNAVDLPKRLESRALAESRGRIRHQFGCAPDALVIGYVGRLSPEKNLADLLKAVSLLIPRLPKLFCWIVGEGPDRLTLEEQARNLGISHRVCFLGFQKEVSHIYMALDVLAISSLTEGTPLAILEAMSFGVPVVSTQVGGIGAILEHGVDGLLVKPGDVVALANSMERVLTNPELAKMLGESAREKVRKDFSLSQWIQKIRSVYWSCLKD